MKRTILLSGFLFAMWVTGIKAEAPSDKEPGITPAENVVSLTNDSFKKLVFNYDANKEWKYEGTKPAIIDFYADWCGPCRQLSPIVEEIAKEYSGRIVVYKVNTDKESLLAQNLGITSLPTLLFIPAKGRPQVTMGALPKATLVKAINEVLMIK
jgi:thioredoxin